MAEITLYGEVGWDFDADWVGSAIDGSEGDVTLRVHSPGGDVFEGVAISNAIRRARAEGRRVRAVVDGLAASAASYMCLTADEVVAGPGAVFMVHPPSGACVGTAEDMRKVARALDTCHDAICGLYVRRTGRTPQAVDEAMEAETWFTADEAVEWGIADRVDGDGPDLSDADARWAAVADGGDFRAFADANPALAERCDEYREHASRFKELLLRARAVGNPAVDNTESNMTPDARGDGSGEAPGPARGDAPRLFSDGWDVYRIGP